MGRAGISKLSLANNGCLSGNEILATCKLNGLDLAVLENIICGTGVTVADLAPTLFPDEETRVRLTNPKPDPWDKFLREGPSQRRKISIDLLHIATALEDIYFPILLMPDKMADIRKIIAADIPNPETFPEQLRRLANHLKLADRVAPIARALQGMRKKRRPKNPAPNMWIFLLASAFVVKTGSPKFRTVGDIMAWYTGVPSENYNTESVKQMYKRARRIVDGVMPGLYSKKKH